MACLDSESCMLLPCTFHRCFGWYSRALLCLKPPSFVDHALPISTQRLWQPATFLSTLLVAAGLPMATRGQHLRMVHCQACLGRLGVSSHALV